MAPGEKSPPSPTENACSLTKLARERIQDPDFKFWDVVWRFEKALMVEAMRLCRSKYAMAKLLNVGDSTLRLKLEKFGISQQNDEDTNEETEAPIGTALATYAGLRAEGGEAVVAGGTERKADSGTEDDG